MKAASEIEKALRIETRAEDSSHEQRAGPAYGGEQYRYELLFVGSVAFSHIKEKVELVEEKEELPLKLGVVEPRLIQTDTSLDAGYVVSVTEQKDRRKLENCDLEEFTDKS
jgi:hypothetical protein